MIIDWRTVGRLIETGRVPNFWPHTWQTVVPGRRLLAYEVRLPREEASLPTNAQPI